jgi:hypothetical protein
MAIMAERVKRTQLCIRIIMGYPVICFSHKR